MNPQQQQQHKLNNTLQSILLISTMMILLGALGFILIGSNGLILALVLCAVLVFLGPNVSPRLILRMYQARELKPQQVRELYALNELLSQRAQLPRAPRLFYIPSRMLNAFAVGNREQSAIALTDGLLRHLNARELCGVIAHEISHIRHNDMWVMNLADMISRVTMMLSQIGIFLLIVTLPLLLFGFIDFSLLAALLLIIAPTVSTLLQLALSRTREYDADLGAVELTGDPQGLAVALSKLERRQGGWLERIFMPGRREPDPALLRTHPPTEERIKRLLALSGQSFQPLLRDLKLSQGLASPNRRPRWRVSGLWY